MALPRRAERWARVLSLALVGTSLVHASTTLPSGPLAASRRTLRTPPMLLQNGNPGLGSRIPMGLAGVGPEGRVLSLRGGSADGGNGMQVAVPGQVNPDRATPWALSAPDHDISLWHRPQAPTFSWLNKTPHFPKSSGSHPAPIFEYHLFRVPRFALKLAGTRLTPVKKNVAKRRMGSLVSSGGRLFQAPLHTWRPYRMLSKIQTFNFPTASIGKRF